MVMSMKNETYLMKIYYFVLVPFRKEKGEGYINGLQDTDFKDN